MWKAVARKRTRMQMILHLNRGRPWHVVKKSQLAKVALAVVFKHLHKSPSTILSTFSLPMFAGHMWYFFLVSTPTIIYSLFKICSIPFLLGLFAFFYLKLQITKVRWLALDMIHILHFQYWWPSSYCRRHSWWVRGRLLPPQHRSSRHHHPAWSQSPLPSPCARTSRQSPTSLCWKSPFSQCCNTTLRFRSFSILHLNELVLVKGSEEELGLDSLLQPRPLLIGLRVDHLHVLTLVVFRVVSLQKKFCSLPDSYLCRDHKTYPR